MLQHIKSSSILVRHLPILLITKWWMMPVVEKVLVHILLGQKLKLVGEMGDLAVSNPDAE